MKPYADHFSSVAGAYAARRPGYPEELFEFLAGVADRHELAWDCAAGSGQATVPLTRFFRRVVATDASAAMLDRAPRHPGIDYRVAPAESSGLITASVDLVTVAQALHWLDLQRFYSEVDRVLGPRGILAVWTYGNQTLEDESLNRLLHRFYHEVVGPYWAPERRHVEAGYRTLTFPYPEIEPPPFEMHQHWNLGELLGYLGTWSATQRYREEERHDPVEGLAQELKPLWGDPMATRRVSWPLSMRVGRRPS